MTIAISLKVNDGVVLAADSAVTLMLTDANGQESVVNIYNNANKILNLRKGLPIGVIVWGGASIGDASISTLLKDLRRRLSGEQTGAKNWKLQERNYTMQSVAQKAREFLYDDLYTKASATAPQPSMGMILAGYSAGVDMAEEYQLLLDPSGCTGPTLVRPVDQSGVTWNGQPEAISRLMFGYGSGLPEVLEKNLGVPATQIAPAMDVIRQALALNLASPAMPIQDAIDAAEFLVDLTIKFSRFMPGAPVVGGPIEVAAITKHEGFKWVRRKHYYSQALNPEVS